MERMGPLQELHLVGFLVCSQKALQRRIGAFLVLAAGVERAAPIRLAHGGVPHAVHPGRRAGRLEVSRLIEESAGPAKRRDEEGFARGLRKPLRPENAPGVDVARAS